MDSRRQPSTAAAGTGGGTSSTVGNSTTSAPRRQGAVKPVATCREDKALLRSLKSHGQPLGQTMCGQGGHLARLNCIDIKYMLD